MLINNVEKSVSRSVVSNSRKHVRDVVNWGQGAQKLRMLAALLDLSSVATNHTGELTMTCNSISRGSNTFLWLPWTPTHICAYKDTDINIHIINNYKNK